MKQGNNIFITAQNNANNPGFCIYLVFSGRQEFLTHHRHNGLLYNLLKDGMTLNELRRWRFRYQSKDKLNGMVRHLLRVIDDYMLEKEAC